MSEKMLKLCRILVGVSIVAHVMGYFISGYASFDTLASVGNLVYFISRLLLALALFASNGMLLAISCGTNALSYALFVIGDINQGVAASAVLWDAMLTAGYIMATVLLFRRKKNIQLLLAAFAIGAAGILLSYLLETGYTFLEKMSMCFQSVSSLTLRDYLPILLGVLAVSGNALVPSTSSDEELHREKALKLCRYVAGAAMVLVALGAINVFSYDYTDFTDKAAAVIYIVSCLLLAVGLFISKRGPMGISWGVRILYTVIIAEYAYWDILPEYAVETVLTVVGFVLLTIAVFLRKGNVPLLIIAFIISAVGSSVGILFNSYCEFAEKLSSFLFGITNTGLEVYLPILVGMLALGDQKLPAFERPVAATPAAAVPVATVAARIVVRSPAERVTKLKELLDLGIITQEEFDAKKKEILNL